MRTANRNGGVYNFITIMSYHCLTSSYNSGRGHFAQHVSLVFSRGMNSTRNHNNTAAVLAFSHGWSSTDR